MISFRTLTDRLSPARLSIRQALALGIGVMAVGAVAFALVVLDSGRRVEESRARLSAQNRIGDAVDHGILAFLEARRHERDFLVRQQEYGAAEARSRYIPLFKLRIGDLDESLRAIRESDSDPGTRAALDRIAAISQSYRAAFLNVAEMSAARGSFNVGLLGSMRRKGDEIEAMLGARGSEHLLAEVLRLRHAKTDYVLSGGMQHALAFRRIARRIAVEIAAARGSTAQKEALTARLRQFTELFEEYVALTERIESEIARFRDAASEIQPALTDIREHAQEHYELTRRDLQSVTQTTTRITVGLQILGFVLACLMAAAVYRKIATLIAKVEDFSGRIGRQDFAARFETRAGGESARLAAALNSMADALQRSAQAIGEYEAELRREQRVKAELLTSVSHELKTPLHAIVGFAELLGSGAAGPLEPRQRECATQIATSGLQLAELINRILEATRVDSGKALDGAADGDLPALLRHAESRAESPVPAHADAASASPLVLLVDDHPVNRAVLARQLQALGYACEVAADGSEALEKWRSGRFGLVITDCDMPVMDGYGLAREIRAREAAQRRGRTPIIACSAKPPAGEAQRCIAAGMDDYIAKPFEMAVLRERLARWLRPTPAAAPATPEERSPPPVDHGMLAEISGGDADFARQIITHFLGSNAEDAALLAAAVKEKNTAQLVHAAHRMKGASRTVGATDFAAVCGHLEAAGRADDWNAVTEKLASFHVELERLNLHLGAEKGGLGRN